MTVIAIKWHRIPILAAIVPLGFLFIQEIQGDPFNLWDYAFLWFFGMLLVFVHLLILILRESRNHTLPRDKP
ncbi:MAG TPA: hypothetical protein VNW25_00075 [Candidatus Sulfotelmatobacter sp.]|jgi:hypothetical protein|nr:hypothetical protein [Candidatus Sulfotelmatobacter sp.]